MTYVDQRVSSIISNAPGILDTLGEIATSLAEDPAAFVNLTSSITAIQSNNDAFKVHGLQSYYTNSAYRTKYTGPYKPSEFSTIYSESTINPYENLYVKGSQIFLETTPTDSVTYLPSYQRKWMRVGTLDLTDATVNTPLNVSTLTNSYNAIQTLNPGVIPYYDVYIQPSKVYGNTTDYGYVSYNSNTPVQVHSGNIIVANQSDLYNTLTSSANGIDGSNYWFGVYKDAIPELERFIEISNANIIGSDMNLFVSSSTTVFEMAPGDKMEFLYTHNGWRML